MAKQTKQKSIEETLCESANKLTGLVEPEEYKHVVLGILLLKFACDKFDEQQKKLLNDGEKKYIIIKPSLKKSYLLTYTPKLSHHPIGGQFSEFESYTDYNTFAKN